jgi:hypothetical protein
MAPFEIDGPIECYMLPDDGTAAQEDFLQHLDDPSEMYIIAYQFSFAPMIDELLRHFAAGDPVHIYLDRLQSRSGSEKVQVQRLVENGLEVTIGTSPMGSRYICHTKGVVCLDNPPWCIEGSTNFSLPAWKQVNTFNMFKSAKWADAFVTQFKGLRHFAWTKEPKYQLMDSPPSGVT